MPRLRGEMATTRLSRQLAESRVRVAALKRQVVSANATANKLRKSLEENSAKLTTFDTRIRYLEAELEENNAEKAVAELAKKAAKKKVREVKRLAKLNQEQSGLVARLLAQKKEIEAENKMLKMHNMEMKVKMKKLTLQSMDPMPKELLAKTDEIIDDLLVILSPQN